jgi:hypothetical protein
VAVGETSAEGFLLEWGAVASALVRAVLSSTPCPGMVFFSSLLQLLLALPCVRGAGGSLWVPFEYSARRLVVVLPFTQHDAPALLANIARWRAEGEPCPLLRRYEARHYVDFVVRASAPSAADASAPALAPFPDCLCSPLAARSPLDSPVAAAPLVFSV